MVRCNGSCREETTSEHGHGSLGETVHDYMYCKEAVVSAGLWQSSLAIKSLHGAHG